MSHSCSHEHPANPVRNESRRLSITLGLVATYFLAELIGGWWTGSLALLADAGHMFSDMAALGISLFAAWMVARPSSSQMTYGYHRAETLAATFNSALLFVVAGGILHEAWERWHEPEPILAGAMLWIALGGLIINLISLKVLHGGHQHSLNMRGAWLHVLGDTLGSVGVIIAAWLVWTFGWIWADPVASVMVCLLVLYSSWNLLAESVGVLMEHAPKDIDVQQVEEFLTSFPAVRSVHCLHVWMIASHLRSLSAHVVLDTENFNQFDLHRVRKELQSKFGIEHTTLQIENAGEPVCEETGVGSCLVIGKEEAHHNHS